MTFGRIDGLAVTIESYGPMFCEVRYIGHRGKAITRETFAVPTFAITAF